MKRTLAARLIILLLLPVPSLLGLPSTESLAGFFTQANGAYQKGDFASAERLYRQMLDAGSRSGSVYYNLGNVCFKQGRLGEAIYYWEEARQIMPNDPDTAENLDLASLMIVDRIDVPPEPLPVRTFRRMQDLLSMKQEIWILLILFFTANSLFSAYLLLRNPRLSFRALSASIIVGVLALLVGCSLAWKSYEQNHRREGIVIEQKADVRSGPGTENITVFTVHEGIKVRVRGEAGGWYQVSLPNGWNGWLQRNALRIL